MNNDLLSGISEDAGAENYRIILCGANAYEKKY